MASELSPEFRLAAACCLWPPSDRAAQAVAEAANRPLDWTVFAAILRRHRIIGLAHHALSHAAPSAMPSAVLAELRRDAMLQTKASLHLAAETIAIDKIMRDAGIDAAILKGAPLARLAYGDLGLRHSRDIDLLVVPQALPAAIALLEQAGYRPFDAIAAPQDAQRMMRYRYHLEYRHPQSGVLVELHWRLSANPRRAAPHPAPSTWTETALSASVGVRSFAEPDLSAYLFMHGAQHCWFRLKWLADIGALLAVRSDAEIIRMVALAAESGQSRPVAQGLLLAARLLNARLPPGLEARLAEDRRNRWLVALAMAAMTATEEPQAMPFGQSRIKVSQYLLQTGWRYWLAETAEDFACDEDWRTVPLPRALHWLYPLIRLPLWAIRQARRYGSARRR